MTEMQELKKLIELNKKKKELKKELNRIESEIKELYEPIMDFFYEEGIDKVTVEGNTVYLKRTLWVKAKNGDNDYTITKMKEVGLGDFVKEKFNTQSVSAYIRELEETDPEEFNKMKEIFDIIEVVQPQITKGGGR